MDLKTLENATQSRFIAVKAYSAIYDTVENAAKQAARFPRANFTDVIPAELKKDKYHSLVLQSGSVDITNLNTKDNPAEYIEYFKQETVISAKSIFLSAENALSVSTSLKNVVLMKHVPRYDPSNVDPLCIKPALSQLFNNTVTELWMNSKHKDKIAIGSHTIECTGAIN